MASFFHVHLKKISQIVKRRRRVAKQTLLFDRSRFRVALRNDQAAQRGAMLARNLLPDRLAEMVAEADTTVVFFLCQEYSPAIIGHFHVIECRPTFGVHADRRAQIHTRSVEIARSEPVPPIQKFRLPVFQRALQRAIRAQAHVVRYAILIIRFHYTRSRSNFAFDPLPKSFSAPCSPVALGRMKIQFCQAESRPKIFVSVVSAPGKRRLASIPVSASGERLARSSIARRSSSSQSRSSGATVTRPSSMASSARSAAPAFARSFASFR